MRPCFSCWAVMRWSGGLWATARRGAELWKREKDDTATSPVSGESGWLLLLLLYLEGEGSGSGGRLVSYDG